MNKKIIVIIIIGVLVVGSVLLYVSTKSKNNDNSSDLNQINQEGQIRDRQNITGEMPYQPINQEGSVTGNQDASDRMPNRPSAMDGRTVGEITAKNNTSITVKLFDGTSQIVLISSSTTINKMTAGSITTASTVDLIVGENVMVTGETNADRSINAESIQLIGAFQRPSGGQAPAMPPR